VGSGVLKTITATSGSVNPGAVGSDGMLTLAGGSQATALSGATLAVDLDQQSVCDQLVVGNGSTLNLNGAKLSVNVLGTTATPGSVYTIVSSATGGISGTFTGLANNATLTAGGRTYRINYSAKAVTLTELT